MFKKLAATLVVSVLALTLSPASAQAWAPREGASFNNPWGDVPAKNRLLNQIKAAINHTPKGAYIRIAAYSNDRKDITDALIRAHRRGAHVQMLLNDNWTSHQTRRLKRKLGTDVTKRHFLRICKNSCRGRRGNLHSKFYLFSKTGSARNVVMFGSVNLTGYAAKTQWNDLYVDSGRKAVHGFLRNVFNEMKRDKIVQHPFIRKNVGAFTFHVYPRYNTTASNDPLLGRLKRIRCKNVRNNAGINGRSMIRINMFGWNGERGVYLAKKVADLSRKGCNIQVIESNAGGRVVQIMARNGVQIKTADFDRNNNGSRDMFTHDKYMILGGRMYKKSGWHVWTGSQNWSDRSLNGDELTVHVPRRGVFYQYRQNFEFIWRKHSKWVADTKPVSVSSRTMRLSDRLR